MKKNIHPNYHNIKVEMNKNYDIIKSNINGALGDSIEFLFSRNDTTYNSKIFLTKQQFKQNSTSFLSDIKLIVFINKLSNAVL